MKTAILVLLGILLGAVAGLTTQAQEGELTNQYTTPSGSFSFYYPDGWFIAQESDVLVLVVNSASMADFTQEGPIESGQIVMAIYDPEIISVLSMENLAQVAQWMLDSFSEETPDLVMTDIQIGGRLAERIAAESDPSGTYVFTTVDGQIGMAMVVAAPGEFAEAEQQVLPILATVTATTVAPTPQPGIEEEFARYESAANGIAFHYPANWVAQEETYAPSILISSNAADPQSFSTDDELGGLLSITQATWIDPDLSADAPLETIIQAEVENDPDFGAAEVSALPGLEQAAVMAYDTTFGETTIFLLRLPNDYLLKLRVSTPSGRIVEYLATITEILRSVTIIDASAFEPVAASPVAAGPDSVKILPYTAAFLSQVREYNFPGDHLENTVAAIDISPDDRYLAAVGQTTVYIIDLETGEWVHELEHDTDTLSVDFSPDGRQLLVGVGDSFGPDQNNRVLLWDIETETVLHETTGVEYALPVEHVVFNPDGALFGMEQDLAIYSLESWEVVLEPPEGELLAFSPDGSLAAATYTLLSTKEIHIYSIADGAILARLTMPSNQLTNELEFSSDGSLLAVGYTGFTTGRNEVQFWDTNTWQLSHTTVYSQRFPSGGSMDTFETIEFSPDGSLLATGGLTGTIWLWDTATGRPVNRILRLWSSWSSITDLAFSANGRFLYVSSNDGTVSVWGVADE